MRKVSDAVEGIIFAFDKNDNRRNIIRKMVGKIKLLEDELEYIIKNYDCDYSAHKYNTPCHCCSAHKALKKSRMSSEDYE